MDKNEWLAERVGLHHYPECECISGRKGPCWGESEETYGKNGRWHFVLPNFEKSLDAQVKWVWTKLSEIYRWVITFDNDDLKWEVIIECESKEGGDYRSFGVVMDSLPLACFSVCCLALGWEEPHPAKSESVHNQPLNQASEAGGSEAG